MRYFDLRIEFSGGSLFRLSENKPPYFSCVLYIIYAFLLNANA